MATIRDVAQRAGVAPITVSRVLNNSGYFRPEIKARVEAAAGELHYVPNQLARSLRSNRTHMLALIVSDVTNPFWTTVARGVEDAASEQGYTVILGNTDENEEKQAAYLSVLLRKRVDGVLLVPARSTSEPVKMIQKQGVQVVVLDRAVPGAEVDIVRCSSLDGSHKLIGHLLGQGHRRIAVLAGPKTVSVSHERLAGYKRAFAEARVSTDDALIFHGEFTIESGQQMMNRVIESGVQPSAIFAMNNFIAIGVLKALHKLSLRVPEDISLVSFDDLPTSLVVDPFLTVVAQPAYEIGQRATQLLLQRIADPDGLLFQEVILPTELIIRRSSQAMDGGR